MSVSSTDSTEIRIAGIARDSIVDGEGIRLTVFTQGCPRRCPGCHNPDTHAFEENKLIGVDELFKSIMKPRLGKGVTFSGGEPFCQAAPFAKLGEKLKATGIDILIFTGYEYEELIKMAKYNESIMRLIKTADYIVDGKYKEELRDLSLKFRGSSNQRIIDVKKTLEACQVVEAEF